MLTLIYIVCFAQHVWMVNLLVHCPFPAIIVSRSLPSWYVIYFNSRNQIKFLRVQDFVSLNTQHARFSVFVVLDKDA